LRLVLTGNQRMKKTLFLKTELGQIVVPKLENTNWPGLWAFDSWLKKYFKTHIEKAPKENWARLSKRCKVQTLIEENGTYRVEE